MKTGQHSLTPTTRAVGSFFFTRSIPRIQDAPEMLPSLTVMIPPLAALSLDGTCPDFSWQTLWCLIIHQNPDGTQQREVAFHPPDFKKRE
jgi:hypothetical protein